MRTLITTCFLFTMLVFPSTVQGQIGTEVGVRGGLEVANIQKLFVGAEARLSTPRLPIQINPAFDIYLIEDGVNANGALVSTLLFQIGMNALYPFNLGNAAFSPYVGGGPSLAFISVSGVAIEDMSASDIGLNLIGGSTFVVGDLKPFAQVQVTVGGSEFVTLGGGFLFSIRGE